MSAESPRHARSGGPLTVAPQPPPDRSIIDAVSGFINDVTLSSSSASDPKDVIQWARFETADINEPTIDGESDIAPLLLVLGYGSGVQVWLIPPNGEAQEVLSWRQGVVRVLRVLPTPAEHDSFAIKRPLIALCDSVSPGAQFCSLSFISIRGGEQVKNIKFKNAILDVLANKRSVVVSFTERFAVFDAGTLEDRMSVTTCYPCPCPLGGSTPINPLALGDRWLGYADKKINPSKRSSGGCEGEGVTSYTATVLQAAKSLGKGLRGLGESVAQSLAGGRGGSPPTPDMHQPGVVTVIDIEGLNEEDTQDGEEPYDPIVAHFVAHSEPILALAFDASGMLLVTADKRGHDFHVFRLNPHPCGPSLASVHHLYILHRGDTTAKVQDIAVSCDARWAAVSTLRGTTHVFAMTPYGGAVGARTHTQARVVNRQSRFQRSAGLPLAPAQVAARAASPVGESLSQSAWFPNPRLPPYPAPVSLGPLAQLRPTAIPTNTITRNSSGRQRLSSLSEESNSAPLLARARFGLVPSPPVGTPKADVALYLMTANGRLLHLLLHPRPVKTREKICDDSPIEVEVEEIAQWPLQRQQPAADLLAPLPSSNPLLQHRPCRYTVDACVNEDDRWLAHVEIVTHAGPHRRLWMGPQFVFKTYTTNGSNSSLSESDSVEVVLNEASGVARSTPVNVPGVRAVVPLLIHSGSASSLEHSPSDSFRRKSLLSECGRAPPTSDHQLREDLAEAMREDAGGQERRSPGRATTTAAGGGGCVERAVDPAGVVVAGGGGGGGSGGSGGGASSAPLDDDDIDEYTLSNEDEARFRPVIRAPPCAPPSPPLRVRPLPRDTRIPVETLLVAPLARSPVPVPAPSPPPPPPPPAAPAPVTVTVPPPVVRVTDPPPPPPPERPSPARDAPCDAPAAKTSKRKERRDLKDNYKKSEVVYDTEQRKSVERTAVKPIKPREVETKLDSSEEGKPARPVVDDSITLTRAEDDIKGTDVCTFKVEDKEVAEEASESIDFGDDDAIKSSLFTEDSRQIKENQQKQKTAQKTKQKTPEPYKKSKGESSNRMESSFSVKLPLKYKDTVKKDDIKTEEQAWDLLLNETEQNNSIVSQPIPIEKSQDDAKTKTKKTRKNKKPLEETSSKSEEDSFVEIHTIDNKPHDSSESLVSIPSSFEIPEIVPRLRNHSPKVTSEKALDCKKNETIECTTFDMLSYENTKSPIKCTKSDEKSDDSITVLSDASPTNSDKDLYRDTFMFSPHKDGTSSECSSFFSREPLSKPKKCKSLSPYPDTTRRHIEKPAADQKELIVINSITDHFADVQITKGSKNRKKSPQLDSSKKEEIESVINKPSIKSWSDIAATKNTKLHSDIPEKKHEKVDVPLDTTFSERLTSFELNKACKRNDLMLAECDKPSDSNFAAEHTMADLPPLEPLHFPIHDFSLESFRSDSLQDIESPICKINIDHILSSMKGATTRAIGSRPFNLESLSSRTIENDFSIIEEGKSQQKETMEKSSDEDNSSPAVSAESDKEDKCATGASSSAQSSSKQSNKSKKSRKKKK